MQLRAPSALVAGQFLAGMVAFAILAFWPPERGPMLLVPASGDPVEAINAAVAGGAALIGQGPVPGSIVVSGDRGRISDGIVGRAMLLVAAPPAGCRNPNPAGATV